MKSAVIGVSALVFAVSGIGGPAVAAEAIKPGRWQFTSQLQAAAAPASAKSAGGAKATYTSCIASDNAVPTELGPQCKLDSSERHGARLVWSMTCTNSQNSVRSHGEARYRGDTMEATMTSHLPGAGGTASDMTQHITGHYLGACLQAADMPMTPSHPNTPSPKAPPPSAPPRGSEPPQTPAKPAEAATPDVAATAADAAAAADHTPAAHRRHAPHHSHYASRRGHFFYPYSGAGLGTVPYSSGFGPAPYSSGGP
jgi:hypothetical protein